MKEQQFLRQIQKTESESKHEVRRLQDKYDSMLLSRQREWERKLEELEERLGRAQDESEEARRKHERLEKEKWELRKQIEDQQKNHDKHIQQMEKVIEQMKNDIRDRERETASVEIRENYGKQELTREIKDRDEVISKLKEEIQTLSSKLDTLQKDQQSLREQNLLLKATV